MKISKKEFMQLENFLLDQVRDGNSLPLNDLNFGLLPSYEPGREPYSVDINNERVEVHQCRAVTRAGARIEVVDMDLPSLRKPFQQLVQGYDLNRTGDWYVLLKVDPFVRLPYGQPAPDSHPLRHLNAMPLYELEVVPKEQVQGSRFAAFCVPLAKIRSGYGGGGWEQVRNYLPPCVSVNASIELLRKHKGWEDDVMKIEEYAVSVIKKLMRKKETEKANPLADDIYLLAFNLVDFITQNIDHYRLVTPQEPPVSLVEFFMRMARIVRMTLRLSATGEGMMRYLQAYVGGFQPAAFKSVCEDLCSVIYNHFEIREAIDKVEKFVSFLKELTYRLEELDYKVLAKYDPVIHEQQDTNPTNKGWSPPVAPTPKPPIHRPGITIKQPGGGGGQGGGGNTEGGDWGLK